MKLYKKILGYGLVTLMFCSQAVPALAAEAISQADLDNATSAPPQQSTEQNYRIQTAQANNYTLPNREGTLTANVWRQSGNGTTSGNTLQWDYQVSAVYSGPYTVTAIRTTWQGSASLRNSASINLGISGSGGSAGGGSSWQTTRTVAKYWENNNGAKTSDYRSNMIVAPSIDYREDTISLVNTASVTLLETGKIYQISAGV